MEKETDKVLAFLMSALTIRTFAVFSSALPPILKKLVSFVPYYIEIIKLITLLLRLMVTIKSFSAYLKGINSLTAL